MKSRGDVRIETRALKKVIEGYSREAGVRRLEKNIGAIVRKAVIQLLEGAKRPIVISAKNLEDFLGRPLFEGELRQRGVGIVTGLAWTAMGGATLPVEAVRVHDRQPGLRVTGQLGDVMTESSSIAYSYVSANAEALGIDVDYLAQAHVHLHVPAGATPKDGPSAGVTMATAIVSLARGASPDPHLAMTGELTLTGAVYPVGGIREKLLAAKRQGFKRVVLPKANERDWEEVPAHVKAGIEVFYAEKFADVVEVAFP